MYRTKNNYNRIVGYFSKLIVGFNEQSLSFDDLALECSRHPKIEIRKHRRMEEARGGNLWVNDRPYIYLSKSLSPSERIVTGFHELYHARVSPPGINVFFSTGLWNWPQVEWEANIVGVVALMPDCEIKRMSVAQIMARYSVSKDVARFRYGLLWY